MRGTNRVEGRTGGRWWAGLAGVLAATALAACSQGALVTSDDAAAARDFAAASDLAAPAPDLTAAPDLAPPADLALPTPDLAKADLSGFVCYDPGSSFPRFRADCVDNAGCFAGIHQIDCCGSHAAYGVSIADKAAFTAAEAAFRVTCPANCKCVARPTACDDGKSAPDDQVTVACEQGRCRTHGL